MADWPKSAIRDPIHRLQQSIFFQSPISAVGLSHLTNLPQLRELFFNTCPINDSDLASLKSIATLRRLTLLEEAKQANPNRFSERGFQEIGQLKSLDFLWLVRLKVSDAAARHLKGLTNLKMLQLSRCQVSDQAVAELREALPNCEIKIFGDEP
jgi:Leucine-rich repeat (LRR) protein